MSEEDIRNEGLLSNLVCGEQNNGYIISWVINYSSVLAQNFSVNL